MNKEGVVIAFDFGLKRIGCAVGQKLTGTASPIGTIENNKKNTPGKTTRTLVMVVRVRKAICSYVYKIVTTRTSHYFARARGVSWFYLRTTRWG